MKVDDRLKVNIGGQEVQGRVYNIYNRDGYDGVWVNVDGMKILVPRDSIELVQPMTPEAQERALDAAVDGLRKLKTYYSEADPDHYACVVSDVSNLLDKIGATR